MRFFRHHPQLRSSHRPSLNDKADKHFFSHFLATMSTLATIIEIHTALESSNGTEAQDARNETMCGATRGQLDNDLAQEQKHLLIKALSPMELQPPVITFEPFQAPQNSLPPVAFLSVTLDQNSTPLLRVLSSPQPIANTQAAITSISGMAAFTRTTDPLSGNVFLAGDIEFTKSSFSRQVSKLCSCRIQLSTQQKQQVKSYLGDNLFEAVKNLLPFRRDGEISFQSPSSSASRRNCTNLAIPRCWPLPRNHTITLQDDIPLPINGTAAETAFQSFNCRDTSWLTNNPLFDVWLRTATLDPTPFVPVTESYFSINESATLADYQSCVAVARTIMADSMLVRGKQQLLTAISVNPDILTAEQFPPLTIPATDLCTQTITPVIPWVPAFSFQQNQPIAVPTQAAQVPTTLNTTTPSVTSTVTTATASSTIPKKHHTATLRWMAMLACEIKQSNTTPPIFDYLPSSVSLSTTDPSLGIPTDAVLLPPLHETFEALLRSRNGAEASSAMSHRFELSRSSAHPNIVTNYLLHCGPDHGPFFNAQLWETIVAASLCAAPLSATPYQGFSPLTTLLLNPVYGNRSKFHPQLPQGGFPSFHDVLRCINGCKWFVMSIGHPALYEHSLAFQGLSYLETAMTAKNLAARWQEPTIRTAPASYQVLELIHNLFSALSATASNLPPSCSISVMTNSNLAAYVASPKIQDATLTIDLRAAIANWKASRDVVVMELGGASSSLTSLLQGAQPISISHYLFRSSSKRKPDPSPDADKAEKDKSAKKQKRTQAEQNKAVIKPTDSHTIKDLIQFKNEGKIAPPRLSKMKGIQNRNGAALCFTYLLGEYCDASSPCGYHLQVNEPSSLPGSSKEDYKSFHDWLSTHKSFICLTAAAASNSKLAP